MATAPNRPPLRGIRRILLATDLSNASSAATEQAFDLARELGAELLVVSVIDVESGARAGQRPQRMDQRRATREHAAQTLVARGRREGIRTSFLVWEGEPGPAILDAASSEAVDLVVVGTHARGAIGRLLIGSVSDFVVRNAACPVLVVRPS